MSITPWENNDFKKIFEANTRFFEPITTIDGFEEISADNTAVVTLTVPADAVGAALAIENGGSGSTAVIRYKFGQDPTPIEGMPLYDTSYFEIPEITVLNTIRFIGTRAQADKIWVSYFKKKDNIDV